METVLVTGGAGAIGSNIVRNLSQRGYRVVVIDDLSSGRQDLLPADAVFVHGSVTELDKLAQAFSHRPEYVIHMAALFANQNSVDHPDRDLEVNGRGTLNVLMQTQKHPVRKVVYVSSSCVYGHQSRLDEDLEGLLPETPYGITKLLGEQYAKFWAQFHKFNVAIVRPFNSYGPGELPGRYRNVIPNFFWRAMHGLPLVITGTGDETRDFTYVTDTCDGIVAAMLKETRPAEIFNIASGKPTRIGDLARMINELAGNPAGVELRPRRGWDGILHRTGLIGRARERLGYEPKVALAAGLEHTYRWLKENASKAPPPVL